MEQTIVADSNIIAIASSYISYANTLLVFAAVLIAILTIGLTMYYNREQVKVIKETTNNILEKISQDDNLRDNFIQKILSNKDFQQQFEAMVDIHIQDKMDDIAEKTNKEEEKNEVGELK
ncbi:hypothetical protein [Helicobacter sp. T3_23-1056]